MVKTRHLGRLLLGLVALLAFSTGARAQVSSLSEMSCGKTYTFICPRGYLSTADDSSTLWGVSYSIGTSQTLESFCSNLAATAKKTFTLIPSITSEGQYYLFNIGTSKFPTSTTGASGMGWWSMKLQSTPGVKFVATEITDFTPTTNADAFSGVSTYFKFSSGSSVFNMFTNHDANYVLEVNSSTTSDDGNCYVIFEQGAIAESTLATALSAVETAESTTYLAALQSAVNEASAVKQGTTIGTYTGISDENYAALQTAISTAETAISDNSQSEAANALPTLRSALSTALSGATLNTSLPTDGCFIKIKSSVKSIAGASARANHPYLLNTTGNNTSYTLRANFGTEATNGTDIFYLDASGHILGYTTGYYAYYPSSGSNYNLAFNGIQEGATHTFAAANQSETAALNIITTANSKTRYLFAAADGYTDGGNVSGTTIPTHSSYGYNFFVEEVSTLPVTINSSIGYSTFYTPVGLTYGSDVKAYSGVVTEKEDGKYLVLTELGGKIPAGQAVVLEGSGTVNFTIDSSVEGEPTGDLIGKVNTVLASSETSPYTLQKIDDVVGFYGYTGTNLTGFKAHLSISDGAAVRGFIFDDGTTGINAVETTTSDNGAIYDLQGRRVSNATRGLYIMGGKKVLVK